MVWPAVSFRTVDRLKMRFLRSVTSGNSKLDVEATGNPFLAMESTKVVLLAKALGKLHLICTSYLFLRLSS